MVYLEKIKAVFKRYTIQRIHSSICLFKLNSLITQTVEFFLNELKIKQVFELVWLLSFSL
jgi:hypothetical protein